MSDSSKLVWKNKSFMKSRTLYSQLVNTLISDIGFAKAICECVDSTEVDALAQILVLVFNKANRALALIKALLASEFEKTTEASKGSVMRGNNIVSKLEGAYVRIIGADYLKKIVRQLVEDLLNSPDSFEIDPNKLFPVSYTEDTEHQSVLARNRQNLLEYSQICLDRITDPELIEEMPRQIRAIAGYTAIYANKYFPDSVYPLIGGFLMLRYFGPGMVTPEAWNILPPDVVPNPEARRNLVLLTKLLQNASNNVLFTAKEEYMTCMNSFITSNKDKMQQYFNDVATDPLSNDEPWKDMEAIAFNSIEIDTIDLADLFELHRIIEGCAQKLIPYLQKNADPEDAKTIIDLIESLGSPPKKTRRQNKKDSKAENGENDNEGPAGPTDSKLMDLTTLERAKFLYSGPPNKSGHPVFYLIVQRIKPEFLKNENQLIQYIFKTMDSAVNAGPYSIVIDMSWASITNEMKKTVYTQTQKILKILSRNYRKNVAFIYIVHPNVFTRTLLYFIRPFTSRKFQKKIIEIYNWKALKDYIESDKIALPESSRDYITKSYYVTKVNSKGKKQERLIKFTLNSLLNIDPKSHKIQNEKFLSEISEITSSVTSLELTLSFNPSVESQIKQRRKAKGFGFSDSDDMLTRRYVCKTIQDRDDIIEDIFRCGYLLKDDSQALPQEYRVTKINRVGKHQERLFKLTIDSLLNINDHKILNEMSFSGIEQVALDPKDKDLITLKYKAENSTRKIICKGFAHLLYKCLEESVERFRRDGVHSEDSEKRDIDELHVEGSEEVKRKNGLSVSKSN